MKGFKKCMSAVTAAALMLTALPVNGLTTVYADETGNTVEADVTVKANPSDRSTFNDKNGDGLGEFEGWGTSLCWWANRLGYDKTLTDAAARDFFSAKGLNMNIGRYNIGGGDHVGEVEEIIVPPNQKATVYDLETNGYKPTYAGSKMEVKDATNFKDTKFTVSDADFGFTKGKTVGTLKYIGWIKNLDGAVGDGDNLTYTVNVPDAGKYTVKLLMMHNNNTARDVAVRVGGAEGKTYVADNAQVQNSKVVSSSGDKQCLFIITIDDIDLKAGDNTVEVAGQADWTLDFMKMLVVKTADKGVVPEPEDKFLHAPHIKRSDSAVPGYCVDETEMDLPEKGTAGYETKLAEYKAKYDRVDETSGWAWNYDWTADRNQWNILQAARKAHDSGNDGETSDFIAEAFSNSPPYFMTNSGCSSGAEDAGSDNLRADCYKAFAAYMADIIVHWAETEAQGATAASPLEPTTAEEPRGVYFQSATPMNEPYTNYWGAYSEKQEGCHFDQGASESNIIIEMDKALKERLPDVEGEAAKEAVKNIIISGTDETSIDTAITSYKKLSGTARKTIERIDTHTYSGSKRTELRELAETEGKNLWMSEIDGASRLGTNPGEMGGALGFAQQIMTDMNGLKPSAWIMWNAVDLNVDANNKFDANSIEELMTKKNDAGEVMYDPENKGWWGIAIGDHNNKKLILTRKYYAYGQFSRYIRPGYTIMGSDNQQTLVVYDSKGKRAVIVAINTDGEDKTWKFDLSRFETMGTEIELCRTSGTSENGENWKKITDANISANAAEKYFTATMKANSINTFIVEGVGFNAGNADEAAKREKLMNQMRAEIMSGMDLGDLDLAAQEIPLTAEMVTGSEPWTDNEGNNNGNTVDKVVDGKFDTFFDGVGNGYVQVDLGEGKAEAIAAYGYAPRSGYMDRAVGASLYGSNDGNKWTLLHTISEIPPANKLSYAYMNEFETVSALGQKFRYYKYAVGANGNCNIAELKLYRMPEDLKLPEIPATLEKWVEYCEGKTDGKNYETTTKQAYDTALKAAKDLNGSEDVGAKTDAQYALFEAYLGLKALYNYTTFSGTNGDTIYDTNGEVIQAHGGQVQKVTWDAGYDFNGNGDIEASEKEFWYWIGEDKTYDYRPCPGIHAYISQDLLNWVDIGTVLKTVPNWETFTTEKYFTDLYGKLPEEDQERIYADLWTDDNGSETGCVIERPKMLYNDNTKKYVIWFHADGQTPDSTGGNYAKAKAGIAVSDSPFGPFKLQGSYLLTSDPERTDHGFDSVGGHVRDMNLFKDDDGTAYVLYSSEGNAVMYIAKLNDSYTGLAEDADKMVLGEDFCISSIDSREAPAMFKYEGKYYLITSGCTGWAPNQAAYAVADNPLGPWTRKGDPCVGDTNKNTFQTQSTCVIPVDPENGKYIYMGDRWHNPDRGGTLRSSRYVWLPIEFLENNKIAIKDYSDWSMDVFDQINIKVPTIEGGGKTYYVDSANGNDENDGLTPEKAWKTLTKASSVENLTAGGKILLKAGSKWDGQKLTVKNAKGEKENPVVIGSYGDGSKPQINGAGASWSYNTKEELAAVHVYNSENIVVENLDITNWDDSVDGDYAQSKKLLSGLVVENRDAGKLSNVVIRNNKIHDVNGLMKGGAEKAAGGLIVVVTGDGDNHTGVKESWYDGLTISGNEVTNVCHEAIYMESVWAARELVGGTYSDTSYQNAGNSKWIGSSNVKIDNNYVHDVAGDGIVPINTTDAIVEYNLIHNSADSNWDYSANPNHAALWAWDANNVTFRYNEACHTSMESKGTAVGNDSMAFDFDYGVQNCVYEYNYSHDNLGGFLMLCPGPGATANNIARYNISVNDGLYDGAPVIRMGSGKYGSLGVQIYNNTIYWKDTEYTTKLMPASAWEGSAIKDVEVFNNIFYGPAEEGSVTTTGVTHHDNVAFGGAETAYQLADADAIVEDPKFKDVKNYTEGSWKDGKTTLGTAEGFQIVKDSICIDKGAAHPAAPSSALDALAEELVPNEAEKPEKDYFGNPLDEKADIGAYEWPKALMEDVQSKYDSAVAIKADGYTKESYQKLQNAIAALKAVLADSNAPQSEIEAKAADLQKAVEGLQKTGGSTTTVDKAALQKLYNTAIAIKADGYTADSYQKLQAAIAAAKAVLDNKNAAQSAVDAQVTALDAAIKGLAPVVTTGDEHIKVSKITIQAPSKKLAAGKSIKLTVKITPANAGNKKVTWSVDKKSKKYASISKSGSLKLKKSAAGKTVTVTAAATDGSKKKATIKIKVMKNAVKSIKLKAPAKTLKVNKTMKLRAIVKTTGSKVNKTLEWKSSNTKYATVDKNGKVKAKKAGKGKKVTITASATDGSGKKAKVSIRIK
ncbi:MAG: family 43 glycosylhydrolase [Lachnospiraceae bacterium]|nr:family 43 glycosylhydrolase [Lachnospiraceae bacterium]